jgi:hypothetical protein
MRGAVLRIWNKSALLCGVVARVLCVDVVLPLKGEHASWAVLPHLHPDAMIYTASNSEWASPTGPLA